MLKANAMSQPTLLRLVLVLTVGLCVSGLDAKEKKHRDANFQRENLIAWCIVPFDAKQRGPAERAEMITRLGMKRVAYDWRAKHVEQFEDEILQYKKHDIEFFAFWSWHDSMEPLIRKHGIKPQIWIMCRSPQAETQAAKIIQAAESLLPMATKTQELGLKLGIYNHGGWAGEPENMVAVCRHLREEHSLDHVGIVYNFHHGHEHIERFPAALKLMTPYLLCLNLNGMVDAQVLKANGGEKIKPIGSGTHEGKMIDAVRQSEYAGPIGILDHRSEMDSEKALQLNLQGLEAVLAP